MTAGIDAPSRSQQRVAVQYLYSPSRRLHRSRHRIVAGNPPLQVRLPADAFERLASLCRDRHVSALVWARQVLLNALQRDFPGHSPEARVLGDEAGDVPKPLHGWRPARLPGGGWGEACDRPESLPAELGGQPIEVVTPQRAPRLPSSFRSSAPTRTALFGHRDDRGAKVCHLTPCSPLSGTALRVRAVAAVAATARHRRIRGCPIYWRPTSCLVLPGG